jgi:hypothetical protein
MCTQEQTEKYIRNPQDEHLQKVLTEEEKEKANKKRDDRHKVCLDTLNGWGFYYQI